jgi:hypothetical protein
MDANTAGVLNSVLNIVSIIVTALMVVYVARNNKKINTVKEKVDEYHKEVNGNMAKLLQTTKELATATEKAKHSETNGDP